MTTIECDNLTVRIAGRTIFEHVDLHISEGGMVALTGPSGCGKTTLLHTLGLLQEADGGRLMIDRENVTHATARRRRRFWHDTASFILQDYGIMDEESVASMSPCSLDHLDNVREGTANRYERLSELLDWQKELRNPRLISVEEKNNVLELRALYTRTRL